MLGGVCAGVARSAGLDPLLLRIAVVAVTVLTGGAGLLAYLAAWVLIPREDAPPAAPQLPAGATAGRRPRRLVGRGQGPEVAGRRAAPAPVGTGRSRDRLGTTPGPGATSPGTTVPDTTAAGTPPRPRPVPSRPAPACREPAARRPDAAPAGPPPGAVPAQRSPLEAADDAATALGERLRAPEVQAGARRAAASVSQALAASVDEVGRRVRRDRG